MIQEDFNIFFNTNDFGTTIYKQNDETFVGIFGQEPVFLSEGAFGMQSNTLTVIAKTSDVEDLDQGDIIDILGTDYTIRNIENDETGITTLYIYKQ